jgi:hypothetical protein
MMEAGDDEMKVGTYVWPTVSRQPPWMPDADKMIANSKT